MQTLEVLSRKRHFLPPVTLSLHTHSLCLSPSHLHPISIILPSLWGEILCRIEILSTSMEKLWNSTFAFCILAICFWNFNSAIEATSFSLSLPVSSPCPKHPFPAYLFYFRTLILIQIVLTKYCRSSSKMSMQTMSRGSGP